MARLHAVHVQLAGEFGADHRYMAFDFSAAEIHLGILCFSAHKKMARLHAVHDQFAGEFGAIHIDALSNFCEC